jgi:sulfur carrier protein ThiS
MTGPTIHVRLYQELNDLVIPARRQREFAYTMQRGRTVADLLAELSIPVSLVDLVLVDGEPARESRVLMPGQRVSLYPVFESLNIRGVTRLRDRPLRVTRFAVFGLPGLGRYLRLLGFDARTVTDEDPDRLSAWVEREHRILVAKDWQWLERRTASRVLLIHAAKPRFQLMEVIQRLDLSIDPSSLPPSRFSGPTGRRTMRLIQAILNNRASGR